MSSKSRVSERKLNYAEAIQEAHFQSMKKDKNIFVMGLGVTDYKGIFGTTLKISKHFGPKRVVETPASESALTGMAIGASCAGKRPVVIHARNDFMFLTLDEMINGASKWSYMYNGKSKVPFVVRGIIGKGWGQGPTHSQSIQSVFAHFPGLNLVMPSTPYDAKGFLLAALSSKTPCVIMEHRSLYNDVGHVPKKMYTCDLGKARVVVKGKDLTIVATSLMVKESVKAAMQLRKMGISAEVMDPRSLVPLDEKAIIRSVRKTGRLIVADTSWVTCGFSAEVAAVAAEKAFRYLKKPVKRIGLASCPAPVSKPLEDIFYPNYKTLFIESCKLLDRKPEKGLIKDPIIDAFKGPY